MKTYPWIPLFCLLFSLYGFSQDDHSGHDHGDHEGHDHSGHEEPSHTNSNLSPQALKNMNVVVRDIDSSDYTIYTPVPAYIKPHPLSIQPVYAPFGGMIQLKKLEPGQFIKENQVIATIIREPIARPTLNLVEEILNPASEEFHNAVAQLLITKKSLDVLNEEIKRIESFNQNEEGISIIPQKDYFNLKYERTKTTQVLKNSRSKLEFHGLKKDEIFKLEQGGKIATPKDIWINSLKKNDIWNEHSEILFQSLNPTLKLNRWVIATIGEISAEGLLNASLLSFFKSNKKARHSILEVSSLLQQGYSLDHIKTFIDQDALSNVIEVKAPAHKAGWDLNSISVRNGEKVATGDTLFELLDPSKKILSSEPSGSELVHLKNAAQKNSSFNATPLIPDSSIELTQVKISSFRTNANLKSSVYMPVNNALLSKQLVNDTPYRNWDLIDGTQYKLKIPLKTLKDVLVVPAEAIMDHGSDKVVFVKYNHEVLRRNVIILYQNDEVAVIGKGSDLLPDEPVVIQGAFALQLALIAGTPQAVDPHAGHNH